jgi:hypothetical protein
MAVTNRGNSYYLGISMFLTGVSVATFEPKIGVPAMIVGLIVHHLEKRGLESPEGNNKKTSEAEGSGSRERNG